MNTSNKQIRRKLLLGIIALPASAIAEAVIATPRASEGPFYPTPGIRFDDVDNDLVKIASEVEQAGGEVFVLSGRVLDKAGNPIAGARVEIWQCDIKGRYLHRGDSGQGSRDPAFQGFGHDLSAADGSYSFRTIKPAAYPGRTPHIHVKVLINNQHQLTTQFYLADHPDNNRDWLYRQMPQNELALVTMNFKPTLLTPEAILDIVI
jgi:protocatechuate 3,4-dioxygenase beta subunit